MENKSNERLIYLKDLIFTVLYQWKRILIVAVVLALLLGSIQGIAGIIKLTDPDTLAEITKENQIQQERYEAEVKSLKLQIETLRSQIQSQQEYLANSLMMQLEPYGYYEAVLTLFIDTDYQILPGMDYQNTDKSYAIVSAYQSLLTGQACLQAISDGLGTEPRYVKEIMTINIDQSTNANVLNLSASAPTQEQAQQLLELLLAQVELQKKSITASIGSHDCSVVEQATRFAIDLSLAEMQIAENDRLTNLLNAQTTAQENQAALTAPTMQGVSFSAVVKKAVIFAVIGCVLGVFFAVVVLWIRYIGSSKVYSKRTLIDRTGIKVLGCIAVQSANNPIDRKLRAWEGREQADSAEHAALLAVDIRNRRENATKLLLTGSADAEQLQLAMQQAMPGVQVKSAGDILESATALEALAACDAVVLTEQCDISRYEDVNRRMELIRDYNKQLIGCVLLDG